MTSFRHNMHPGCCNHMGHLECLRYNGDVRPWELDMGRGQGTGDSYEPPCLLGLMWTLSLTVNQLCCFISII